MIFVYSVLNMGRFGLKKASMHHFLAFSFFFGIQLLIIALLCGDYQMCGSLKSHEFAITFNHKNFIGIFNW
jgi:hypothetical protein